jgi:hypothetical protein
MAAPVPVSRAYPRRRLAPRSALAIPARPALLLALAALAALAAPTGWAAPAAPQGTAGDGRPAAAAPSPLVLTALEVEPPSPPPATLCRLRVKVENRGDKTVSALGFDVLLGGREVPSIRRRLYLTPIEPGKTLTLRLPNFWSSEGGRPVAPDGRLEVEVRLTEARWATVDRARKPVTWTLLDPVPGLPSTRRLTLHLRH